MRSQFILFLESIKTGEDVSFYMLKPDLRQSIIDWYEQYLEKCNSIDKAISLLYYFYIHDNLDQYPVDEFCRQCDYLFATYSLSRENVIRAFVSFRVLVYGD